MWRVHLQAFRESNIQHFGNHGTISRIYWVYYKPPVLSYSEVGTYEILITLLIILKNWKEPLTTTQIPFTLRYAINIQKMARAIYFHGRQGLALRGHREILQESNENQNLENFLTYLDELKSYFPELKEDLEARQSKKV